MNRYPIWKYITIALVIAFAALYTAPNFFGITNAVQISTTRKTIHIDAELISRVENILQKEKLKNNGMFLTHNSLKIKFGDTTSQFKAREAIQKALGDSYTTALNQIADSPNWMSRLGANPMSLGLDLRGGVHFLLQVDMKAALNKTMDRYSTDIRRKLKKEKISYGSISRNGNSLIVQLLDAQTLSATKDALSNIDNGLEQNADEKSFKLTLTVSPEKISRIQKGAVAQNIATLHNRVNNIGVAEPIIQANGSDRIVVELPGVQDTAKAKDILGRTASLQIRMVEADPIKFQEAMQGLVPVGYEVVKDRNGRPFLLNKQVELSGDNINDARPDTDDNGKPAVFINLDSAGSDIFAQLTAENVNKHMAMVLVEKGKSEVVTAPIIKQRIDGGNVQISGSMTRDEANEISILLGSGSLAAPMQIIEESTVGPSLGKENISKGFHSTLWGFVAVALFMLFYYRVFGIISAVSLSINLLLLIAILSMLQATLTLPGIAAIALTLGMAIDANVLINERIREELRNGVSPHSAISSGYEHAWRTILDSNVTSLIAGLALLCFGSGPVRGFAIVHCLGITTSMFSAVLFSRAVVNLWYGRRRKLASISIGQIWKPQD